jgi:uncharacterized protein YjlB
MEKEDILLKLKLEFAIMKDISETQFEQRFTTSKYESSWCDELFKNYQTSRIRIDLLLELL